MPCLEEAGRLRQERRGACEEHTLARVPVRRFDTKLHQRHDATAGTQNGPRICQCVAANRVEHQIDVACFREVLRPVIDDFVGAETRTRSMFCRDAVAIT